MQDHQVILSGVSELIENDFEKRFCGWVSLQTTVLVWGRRKQSLLVFSLSYL